MIVYFYPAAMTPGCTKQACDFSESLDSLRGAGYEVLVGEQGEGEGVLRSTFVIDEDGTVELAQYNVKATGHVAKLRRDLGLG